MSAFDEARQVQNSPHTIYDQPTLRRIIAGLIQIIVCERKDHARELQDAKQTEST